MYFSSFCSHLNEISRSQDLLVIESQPKYVKVSLDLGESNNDNEKHGDESLSNISIPVALCQVLCGSDKQSNIESARNAINEVATKGAKWVQIGLTRGPKEHTCYEFASAPLFQNHTSHRRRRALFYKMTPDAIRKI